VRKRHFDSVAEAQRVARRRLPKPIYNLLVAGVERGVTRDNNVSAFDEIGLFPRLADLGDVREQATEVLGQKISFPVIASCVGTQAVHPDGELAVARATKTAGTAIALSNFSNLSVETVIAGNEALFFQLYWYGTKDEIQARVERARRAGAKALIITLDWALTYRRDWNVPRVPRQVDLKTMVRFALPAISHPAWLFEYLRRGELPNVNAPNAAMPGQPDPTFASVMPKMMTAKQPTWNDIAWLREIWGGPFMVKGVMHPDDAMRAVDVGASAISVSNHGGNNVDSTPAAIRVLPAIAEAVNGQIEILFDGGIRRGTDVVKALALGARAVLIGRAQLFALAAGGEDGVRQILDVLRAGINETLLALGRASVQELEPSDVFLPEGFAIRRFSETPLRFGRS